MVIPKTKDGFEHLLKTTLGFDGLNPLQEEILEIVAGTSTGIRIVAQTGSGKTLGFAMASISKTSFSSGVTKLLVICPTRELVMQVSDVFRSLKLGLKLVSIYGGHPVRLEIDQLKVAPDLIIATPGRLCDHLERNTIRLSQLESLVIDEFDKTLELGFLDQIETVFQSLTINPFLIVTSATDMMDLPAFLPKYLKVVESHYDFKAERNLEINSYHINYDPAEKNQTLIRLLQSLEGQQTIVFCNFREMVDEVLTLLLISGIDAIGIHGGLDQAERSVNLIKFRNHSASVLVGTDVVGRGIDIPEVDNVVHYSLPQERAMYLHRNGRTARGSKDGSIYYLFEKDRALPTDWQFETQLLDLNVSVNRSTGSSGYKTIWVNKGKKDKINKGDLVGFLTRVIAADQIGQIDSFETKTFIAVKKEAAPIVLKELNGAKLKKQKLVARIQ